MSSGKRRKHGQLHLRKRGAQGIYYVYFYDANGKQVGKSLGTSDKVAANRLARELSIQLQVEKAKKRAPLTYDEWERQIFGCTSEEVIEQRTREFLAEPETKRILEQVQREEDAVQKVRQDAGLKRQAKDILDPKVEDFWAKFHEWARANRREATVEDYHKAWKRFLKLMTPKRVSDINEKSVQRFIKFLDAKGTHPRTHIVPLKAVFSHAIKLKLHPGPNPFAELGLPTRPRREKCRFLTRQQRETLLQHLHGKDDMLHVFAALCAYAGLRKSEAINLRWDDIDFENGRLYVRAKDDRVPGVTAWQPKTATSTRGVPLNASLSTMLAARVPKTGYILMDHKKRRQVQRIIDTTWPGLVREIGFNWCTTHTLRHTFASILLCEETPAIFVSRFLGHAGIQMTMDTYGHLVKEGQEYIEKL
jgi:integrase